MIVALLQPIEQWARAKGWRVGELDPKAKRTVRFFAGRVFIGVGPDVEPRSEREVSPHAALVWALVLAARPLRDGSKCGKLCAGSGRVPKYIGLAGTRPVEYVVDGTMACPDCDGTGLADLTDAYAQHVLDAQPRPNATGLRFITAAGTDGVVLCYRVDGANETSIEALSVLADRLQAKGHRLGQRIALLLADTPETLAELEREGGETLRSITALRSIREARTTTAEPFRVGSQTVVMRVGADGVHQQAVFSFGDFADFRRASAAEVAVSIMDQVMNVEARVDDGHVVIAGVGEDGSPVGVQITGGTAFDFMYTTPEAKIAPLVRALALG
jgi:hypothetical protein